MKKVLAYILIFILLTISSAMAVETMTILSKSDIVNSASRLRVLSVLCTTDTDGSFSLQLSDSMYEFLQGWAITEVRVINSSAQTDPTVNSDLALALESGGTFDLLHGAGTNMVDNDATNSFPPLDSGSIPSVIYVVDQFYVDVTNNIVDSAVFNIKFIAFPTK